jgi:transcription initiation factor TFIID subunit 15
MVLESEHKQTGKSVNDGALTKTYYVNSDEANFINFCSGETLTNGLQQTGGSCNGVGRCS